MNRLFDLFIMLYLLSKEQPFNTPEQNMVNEGNLSQFSLSIQQL